MAWRDAVGVCGGRSMLFLINMSKKRHNFLGLKRSVKMMVIATNLFPGHNINNC